MLLLDQLGGLDVVDELPVLLSLRAHVALVRSVTTVDYLGVAVHSQGLLL
jgi:hypothetical protein